MARPDIGKCVSSGFEIFKKNPITYVIAWLVLAIVNGMTFGILIGPLMVGYFRMVKIDISGGKAQIGDLFKGFEDLSAGLVAGLISLLAIGIGTMFCVLPGLVAAPLLPVSLYLVAEGEKDGVNAIKRAWHAVSKNLVESVLYMLILGLIAFVGFFLCCVGMFITVPISIIGQFVLAKQISDDGTVQ
jgi:uncharacterized membrane protein